ncbi:MAG: hypothetical protein IID49_12225 [Proteobacteria bacterium]|nr:hypothetical protein [Pseudomonadota bacterium]
MAKPTGNILTGANLNRPGAKLNRSETVSIRLDPRLNYLCELAARSQRRTKSSFIESTIVEKIDSMIVNTWRDINSEPTLGARAGYLWHVRDYERLISLGLAAPHLMTYEEQEVWAVICENGYFWRGRWVGGGDPKRWQFDRDEKSVNRERIAEHWETIQRIAQGEEDKDELPQVRDPAKTHTGSADDEIPF